MTITDRTQDTDWNQRYGDPHDDLPPVPDSVRVQLAHRSVRRFLADEVSEGDLRTLVAAAQSAPTSSNLQPWSVVAVRDPERRRWLSTLAARQEFVAQAPAWTDRVLTRLAGPESMAGRHRLREALERLGLPVR